MEAKNNLEVVAIIPARGGSKSVPKKNIKMLAGKPMIAYTIKAALNSRYCQRVIVSTDDPEIAKVTNKYGAEVPFMRPSKLAADDTPLLPVLQHAAKWLEEKERYIPDIVVLLQPTSPLRMPEHIDDAIQLLVDSGADSVVSVCKCEHPPYWMLSIDNNGRISPFYKRPGWTPEEMCRTPRQKLRQAFRINGAVYVTTRKMLLEKGKLLGDDIRVLIMSEKDSVDVDSEWAFRLAEFVYQDREKHEK